MVLRVHRGQFTCRRRLTAASAGDSWHSPVLLDTVIPRLEQVIVPENDHGLELGGDSGLAEGGIVVAARGKDVFPPVLDVEEEEDGIIAARLERGLGDDGAQVPQVLGLELELGVAADDQGRPAGVGHGVPAGGGIEMRLVSQQEPGLVLDLGRGRGAREALGVSGDACVLELAPVDAVPVDTGSGVAVSVLPEAVGSVSPVGRHPGLLEAELSLGANKGCGIGCRCVSASRWISGQEPRTNGQIDSLKVVIWALGKKAAAGTMAGKARREPRRAGRGRGMGPAGAKQPRPGRAGDEAVETGGRGANEDQEQAPQQGAGDHEA
ncbi:hypothetical protein G6O67_006200 [Ophiocordyceps sinensis]|uniref:Uncharacterized protein n=1 Tax=Ophiocordyceps sinensis TaxID=72228 RepID=A0A8H4PP42_9HYPO|nr:hypothetical protein G6O67_006200 [Ophiocordyceps sinensis]